MKKLLLLIALLAIPSVGSAYGSDSTEEPSSMTNNEGTPNGPSPKSSSISYWSGNSSISGVEKAAEDAARGAEIVSQ